MSQIGRPTGLIAYDTDINAQRRQQGQSAIYRPVRPRTLLYAAIIALVGGIMLYALTTRSSLGINVLHDRNPLFVTLSDGSIRNDYTVRLLNKGGDRTFALDVSGLPGAVLRIAGIERGADGRIVAEVGPDQTRELRISLLVPAKALPREPVNIEITATDVASGLSAHAADHFIPANR
jgi:polyferredoxin